MSDFKYYVFIQKEKHECLYYFSLNEALEKYNSIEMNDLRDCIFLGIESNSENPLDKDFVCFDVLHKFFKDNILINDYMNHQREDVFAVVKEIINNCSIKYQYSSDILNGALIPYSSDFVHQINNDEMKYQWNQVYIETYDKGDMCSVGWQPYTKETYENYGWSYPNIASFVQYINVSCTDKSGVIHDRDIDIREYLAYHGKRFTDCKEMM